MKINFFQVSVKYFSWWVTTLKSCLPVQVTDLFNKYNRDVELLIRHQGDSIFLQNAQGDVIDSISIESNDTVDVDLDINLNAAVNSSSSSQNDIDATHIELSGRSDVVQLFNKKESEIDLDDIDLTERNDTTILFNRDDKTTRLLGLVSEDDTLVIKDDQGTLLNRDSDSPTEGDSTVLYYSDKGRIRAVEARKETVNDQEIDINLLERGATDKEKNDGSSDEFFLAASLLEKYPGNKKCLYLIPEDKVFSLVLSYPIEALENIENVLRYDLEKHIPLNFQEIRFFYALNIISARSRVDVEVIVIKSTVYDVLLAAFEFENQREIICTTKHFYQHYGTKINILSKRSESKQKSILSVGNLHTALNIALLAGLLVLPYQMHNMVLDSVQPKTAEEIKKAGIIVSTINELNAEIELGKKLNAQIKKEHRMVDLLARLSKNIATDAWISRFTYKNGEIKLQGEAVSATSVSDDLNDMGIFESIKFISSIIKIPDSKKETFELLLKVKSDA